MTHTRSSQTYRHHRIAGHEQQVFASMMAMRHLIASYQGAVVRHRKRLILALKNMEAKS